MVECPSCSIVGSFSPPSSLHRGYLFPADLVSKTRHPQWEGAGEGSMEEEEEEEEKSMGEGKEEVVGSP